MGSGSSSSYSGTKEESQPYAKDYGVTPEMKEYDIKRGVYNGTYDKNPTAGTIDSFIRGEYLFSKDKSKSYTYVVDLQGNIIIGERNGNGWNGKATPHPTLIGGENPRVQMAGILRVEKGKIAGYDHMSGHFKPNIKSIKVAREAFGRLPDYLFKGGKKK